MNRKCGKSRPAGCPMSRFWDVGRNRILLAAILFFAATAAHAQTPRVIVLHLDDTIQPISEEYLTRGLPKRAAMNADCRAHRAQHSRRPARHHPLHGQQDSRLAGPGHRLCRALRQPRRLGRLLPPRSGGHRRHGSRHQRRGLASRHRRRPARSHHEAEARERHHRLPALLRLPPQPQCRRRPGRGAQLQVLHRAGGAQAPPHRHRCRRTTASLLNSLDGRSITALRRRHRHPAHPQRRS